MDQIQAHLGYLKSGESVVDRYRSHVQGHGISNELLQQALLRIDSLGQDFLVQELVFPEAIGYCQCVSTTRQDKIVFAQRVGRRGLTRFVQNREAEKSNVFTIALLKVEADAQGCPRYLIVTGYVGKRAPPEPWDEKALKNNPAEIRKALFFWDRHALVWGSAKTVYGTLVRKYPWHDLHAFSKAHERNSQGAGSTQTTSTEAKVEK